MKNQGQTILEYVMLLGLVTIVLVYMSVDMKRAVQSMVKVTADQLGNQVNADQDFNGQIKQGIMTKSMTNTWQGQQQLRSEREGIINQQVGDFTDTKTNTTTKIDN